MNTIYRIVWNVTLGKWVVASELAKGRKKKSSLKTAMLSLAVVGAMAGMGVPSVYAAAVTMPSCVAGEDPHETGCVPTSSEQLMTPFFADGGGSDNGFASSVAIGSGAVTGNANAVAIGLNATANNIANVAIGHGANTTGSNAIAMGYNATANGNYAMSLGGGSSATAVRATSVGTDAVASGDSAVALGNRAAASTASSVAIGNSASVSIGSFSNALGANAKVTSNNSNAVGNSAVASAVGTNAFGNAAEARAQEAVAIGHVATTDAQKSVVIGSQATLSASATGSVALGAGATTSRANVVAVGNGPSNRQIVNLAAGTQDTDAVNLSQLKGTAGTVAAALGGGVTVNADGTITKPSYSVQGATHDNVGDALGAVDTSLTSIGGRVTKNEGDIVIIDGRVTKNEGDIVTIGNRVTQNEGDIVTIGDRVTTAETNITNIDGRVTTNEGDIVDIRNQLGSGSIGLVQQDATSRDITVAAGTDGERVDFTGTDGARQLKGVAEGVADTDAVNLSQLKQTEKGIRDDMTDLVDVSLDGVVKYDDATKGSITLSGTSGTQIKNVADGRDAGDAANFGQLTAAKTELGDRITNVSTQVTNATRYFKANGKNDGSDDARAVYGNDVAIGHDAVAHGGTKGGATVIGAGARTLNQYGNTSLNILDNNATAVVVGTNASANVYSAVLGANAQAKQFATAVGDKAVAGNWSVALGRDAQAQGQNAQAIGQGARASANFATAVGNQAKAQAAGAMALGNATSVTGAEGVAVGNRSQVLAANGVAVGRHSRAEGTNSLALGPSAVAKSPDSVAIGASSVADRGNVVSVGSGTLKRQVVNVSAGTQDTDAVNVAQLKAVQNGVGDLDALAVKYDDASKGSISLGGAAGTRIKNVAAGVDDTDAVNVSQLKAAGLVGGDGSTLDAVVYDAGSNRGSVTFGGVGGTKLTNVMAGLVSATSTDAVNGSQLWILQDQVVKLGDRVTNVENGAPVNVPVMPSPTPGEGRDPAFAATGDGGPASATGKDSVAVGTGASAKADNSVAIGAGSVADRADTVSVGSVGNERVVSNVAAGTQRTDAANWGQVQDALATANRYTDDRFDGVNRRIGEVQRQANRGIAASAAMINVTPYMPGKTVLNAGVANYRGESALGVGVSRWNDTGRVNFNAGMSAAAGDSPIFRMGVGVVLGD